MLSFFRINKKNNNENNHNFLLKIKNLFASFIFVIILIFVSIFIVIYPLDFFIKNYLHFESISELIHKNNQDYNTYPFYLIIFIGPFVEEILFRLILKVNKFNISIFLGLLLLKLLTGNIYQFDILSLTFGFYIAFCILLSIVVYFFIPIKTINFLKAKNQILIFSSVLLFGLVHIMNIKTYHWELILLYPFFVLPQMIMGYFITNLRLKYGFFWGLFLHIIFNAFSVLISH